MQIRPVTSTIGAEVSGVDLSAPLVPRDREAIQRALLEHVVLLFRAQELTPEQHLRFAGQFGEISPAPFGLKVTGYPEMTLLDQTRPKGQGADSWHTDNTFMPEPPLGSILRAVELPGVGGDTCFASMYAAYEALSEPIKRFIEGLQAEHDLTKTLTRAIADGNAEADLADMQRRWPPVVHPVVRTHPVTGRRALFVNGNFTTRIVGLTPEESEAILRLLLNQVRSPDFQCRFRWEPGSVVFWDNRVAQHYGVPDYDERRVMHRVTLAGDRPR